MAENEDFTSDGLNEEKRRKHQMVREPVLQLGREWAMVGIEPTGVDSAEVREGAVGAGQARPKNRYAFSHLSPSAGTSVRTAHGGRLAIVSLLGRSTQLREQRQIGIVPMGFTPAFVGITMVARRGPRPTARVTVEADQGKGGGVGTSC